MSLSSFFGMRTTVRLPDQLMVRVKRLALDTNRSVTRVISDALTAELSQHARAAARPCLVLPTDGTGGLHAGVALDRNADLLDIMDGDDVQASRTR